MRPYRLLASLCFCVLTISTLIYLLPSHQDPLNPGVPNSKLKNKRKNVLNAFFSFNTPLFPPSAIISLTDDNSTFFLARPAAFGPLLPPNGLSGQIWIGSGFGEDNLGRGGRAEGELGCSDVPGWDETLGKAGVNLDMGAKSKFVVHESKVELVKEKDKLKRSRGGDAEPDTNFVTDLERNSVRAEDGTDDHLHEPLSDSKRAKPTVHKFGTHHADIQSLQESAEIAGKVVLLSRGGCGFFEKVKWVQRRGGIALIVGDDVRGGPLVTMYASGDTSNITVSALFTSYTTAHLLSSLIPSGGALGASPIDADKSGRRKGIGSKTDSDNKPVFTSTTHISKPTATTNSAQGIKSTEGVSKQAKSQSGWFRSFLSWIGFGSNGGATGVSRRPPSSGSLDWVLVEDWEDAEGAHPVSGKKISKDGKSAVTSPTADNFVIGVHDWRDPDLLLSKTEIPNGKPRKTQSASAKAKAEAKAKARLGKENKLKGGSITPGSGEYEKPGPFRFEDKQRSDERPSGGSDSDVDRYGEGWLGHLRWGHDGTKSFDTQCAGRKCLNSVTYSPAQPTYGNKIEDGKEAPHHEGLWVTLTPTNMSSSPFFDTLLVLVVSPLVTLTVVYALLLLRSRIRRRRWRAPKSVVERLPVRTYHTISSEASTTSIASPASSSPSTPLLQPSSRRAIPRPNANARPRSRTASDVPEGSASSSPFAEHSDLLSAVEKREAGLAEWRRRYGGRQKECVVCLEEYIDGVSRVMSLPCGHEFHVECITPWLTTRRRTCPICKNDIVRSMQRGNFSRQNPYDRHDDSSSEDEEDIQTQAAVIRNDSPTASLPVPSGDIGNEPDLERGAERTRRRNSSSAESWRDWLWASLGFGGSSTPPRRHDVDRDR